MLPYSQSTGRKLRPEGNNEWNLFSNPHANCKWKSKIEIENVNHFWHVDYIRDFYWKIQGFTIGFPIHISAMPTLSLKKPSKIHQTKAWQRMDGDNPGITSDLSFGRTHSKGIQNSLVICYFTFHIKTNSIFNDRSLILELTSSLSSRVLSFLHDGQFQRITNKTQRNRVQRTFRLVLLFRSVVSRFSGLSVELSFPSRLGRFLEKLIMKIHASSPENAPQDKSRGQRQWSCVDGRTINPYHWDMTAVNGEETSTDSQIHSNIEASRKIWKEKASIFDRWIVHWRLNHEPAQQKYQVNQSRFLWLASGRAMDDARPKEVHTCMGLGTTAGKSFAGIEYDLTSDEVPRP